MNKREEKEKKVVEKERDDIYKKKRCNQYQITVCVLLIFYREYIWRVTEHN